MDTPAINQTNNSPYPRFGLHPYIVENPPKPGSKAWAHSLTASKIPPMIKRSDGSFAGMGYLSAWHQFEELKGRGTNEPNEFMQKRFNTAHAVERPAANWWIRQQETPEQWEISDGEVAYHNPAYPFFDFATIDFIATNTTTGEQVALEIKNPNHPGLQPGWIIQHLAQRIASGLARGEIIVYPIYGDPEIHPVDIQPGQADKIMADVADFAQLLADDTPPGGGDIELPELILTELEAAKKTVAEATKRYDELKAEVSRQIGDHRRVVSDGKVVVSKIPGKFTKKAFLERHADKKKLLEDPKYTTVSESKKFDETAFKADYPDLWADAQNEVVRVLI